VFNQSRDDWDVQILVDRATTDNTYRKARHVRDKSPRRKSIHINVSAEPGLPHVYKELIDRAEPRDDVCAFLDADDRIIPRAVELLMKAYDTKPEVGHLWTQFCRHPMGSSGWSKRLPTGKSQLEAFTMGWWGSQHWRTFKKSVYLQSEYKLQLDVPYATDYNLALVIAATNCECLFLDKPLYVYYQTSGGITQSNQKKQRLCFLDMLRRFKTWARSRVTCEF